MYKVRYICTILSYVAVFVPNIWLEIRSAELFLCQGGGRVDRFVRVSQVKLKTKKIPDSFASKNL